MSAFLGPIHHWLYGKINLQNELVCRIAGLAETNGWLTPQINLNRYPELETGALEDIVDTSNIHGWLQERVSLVENKLAYLVTVLTDGHEERLTEICSAAEALGRDHAAVHLTDAKEAFRYLDTFLLNGMPCDHVNVMGTQSEEEVTWTQATDIHAGYWQAVGGDLADYYAVRNALIRGIFSQSDYQFAETAPFTYSIRKS